MRAPGRRLVLNFGTALSILAPLAVGAADVTIDLKDEKQAIRGFGGFSTLDFPNSDTGTLGSIGFGIGDKQIGLTILRIYVNEDKNHWARTVATAKAAQARGAIVVATTLLPPIGMRTLVDSLQSLYSMKTSAFPDYAAHLNEFVAFMKTNGVNIHAISIQNQPDAPMGTCRWSSDQILQFVREYAGRIDTKVISPESYSYDKRIYDRILKDSTALANLDILGTNIYGTPLDGFPYPLADAKAPGLERWMTEHFLDVSSSTDNWPDAMRVCLDIHNTMVEGNFSTFVWWPLRGKAGPMLDDGTITRRGNCMAQYSKFIRPGSKRVEATRNPTAGVYVSAYAKRDSLVVVAVNESGLPVTLNVSVKGGWEGIERPVAQYTTSVAKRLMKKEGGPTIKNGFFTSSLDAYSVNTFAMNWWFNGIERAPHSTTGGRFEIFSVSGTKIADVTVEEGQMLESHVRRIAPHPGVYLAKPLRSGRPILVNVSR